MLIKCCDKCKRVINENNGVNYAILKYNDRIIDLCPDCAKEVINFIDGVKETIDFHHIAPIEDSKTVLMSREKHNETIGHITHAKTPEIKSIVKEAIAKEKGVKTEELKVVDPLLEEKVQHSVNIFNEARLKGHAAKEGTKQKILEDYGVEKFAREYLTGTPASFYIKKWSDKGMSINDISFFVKKYDIRKKPNCRSKENKDKKEDN